MPAFENPVAFLLLLPLPLLWILRKSGMFRSVSFPLTIADWDGKTFVWKDMLRSVLSGVSRVLFFAGYVLTVTAFADPVLRHQEKVYTTRGTDILFVLDTSPSMASKDIAGHSRLEAARVAIHTLVNMNGGASFGLVAMASEAAAVVPPTADHGRFLEQLDALVIGGLGEGTAIGTGLSAAVYHLMSSNAPRKCIVLITDGENNAGSIHPETAAELAYQNSISLYTLGIGSRGSVPIEYVDPVTGKVHAGYYESEFDPVPLENISAAAHGRYYGIESTGDLSAALATIGRRESVVQSFHLRTIDEQYYDKLVAAAAVSVMLAWILRRLFLQELL